MIANVEMPIVTGSSVNTFRFKCGDENCVANVSSRVMSTPFGVGPDMLFLGKCALCGLPGFFYPHLPGKEDCIPQVGMDLLQAALALRSNIEAVAQGKELCVKNPLGLNKDMLSTFGLLEPLMKLGRSGKMKILEEREDENNGTGERCEHRTDAGAINKRAGKH